MNRYIDQIMNSDIVLCVCRYVNNCQKIAYLSVSKAMHQVKSKVAFKQCVNLYAIEGLFYFDQFEHVVVHERFEVLPKNTKVLRFAKNFNESICELKYPPHITHMMLGPHFSQSIDGCIPDTVKYLWLGKRFQCDIDGLLPESVTHLVLGEHFNKVFKRLPSSLKYLTCFEYTMGRDFVRTYPDSLQHLEIKSYYFLPRATSMPKPTKYLKIVFDVWNNTINYVLPESLVHLDMHADLTRLPVDLIPRSVKHLVLRGLGVKISSHIPIGVERLSLFTQHCDMEDLFANLPSSVKRLDLIPMIYHDVRPDHYRQGLRIKKMHSGVKK